MPSEGRILLLLGSCQVALSSTCRLQCRSFLGLLLGLYLEVQGSYIQALTVDTVVIKHL